MRAESKMGAIMVLLRSAILAIVAVVAVGELRGPGGPSTSGAPLLRLPPVTAAAAGPPPFVDIQGTRLTGADDTGHRQWELRAASLQIDQSRNTIVLTDVTGWLYRADARRLELRAPRAAYFAQTRTVELSGGVSGNSPDGRRFSADRVRWTGTRLVAAGRILVAQEGLTVRADVMSADTALNRVIFEGHVWVTFIPE